MRPVRYIIALTTFLSLSTWCQQGRFSYHAGLFSRSIEEEFDDFNSGSAAVIGAAYDYASSNEDNGLHLQRRYEEEVTQGEGNDYQALYAGLNYFLYGHKLKLMMGGEYARMKDDANDGGEYFGWTWFAAVRLYF